MTLFLIIAVIGGVVFFLTVLNKNPGERVFSSESSASRHEFLQQAFGISKKDCERLHFDGRHFYHPKEIPYESYSGIRAAGSERTTITNAAFPHHTSWKFQRGDGGPDLRYRGNSKSMHSERHFINFYGTKPFTLHVYSYPGYNEVNQLVEKFDEFLCGAQEQDYESEFMAFKAAYEKKQLAQSQLSETQSSLSSCDAVTAAHNKISSAEMKIPDELKAKVNDAVKRRTLLLNEVENLRREIREQAQQESQAVRAAQARSEIALNHRIITQFS
ncbi:MAG: hypothetical protein PHD54_07640 [Desulfuromonadaceae bacterium]|nr:hypothetical protein [Desulfuromonadaceae bacterium]